MLGNSRIGEFVTREFVTRLSFLAESSTLTYGLYAKLESSLGHAFNELYWNVDGDKTPLLTVTNFSDTMERIDIWATRDRGSKILRTVELPAKASVHLNMRREFAERSAELFTLQSAGYGGFHIRAENPAAKVLVKEHIFSLEIPASKFIARLSFRSMEIVDRLGITDQPRPLPRWAAFRTCRSAWPVLPSPAGIRHQVILSPCISWDYTVNLTVGPSCSS